MSSAVGQNNSRAAADWAAKRKLQLERAAELAALLGGEPACAAAPGSGAVRPASGADVRCPPAACAAR